MFQDHLKRVVLMQNDPKITIQKKQLEVFAIVKLTVGSLPYVKRFMWSLHLLKEKMKNQHVNSQET
ncbi:hypothetical protein DERP_000151 [Dermatophagoides pteronyssinus]|uniref:Uncharacterized protein n=1 Tax=Dermatophagoides pteronyssinus TaxID=6956 RepID=A0ABQ8IZP7_DERPT|nr:hypothetical protein DERP_000151 [Dermatophagoides pteronyssinus]